MKGLLAIFSFLLVTLLILSKTADAKVLPQAKGGKKVVVSSPRGSGINVSPKLRKDKKALIINFGNLQNAQVVSYNLIYLTGGREEGAGGTIRPQEKVATRELTFGTCSGNICRYHTNITNMKLEVVSELKSGKKSLKRYRIRI